MELPSPQQCLKSLSGKDLFRRWREHHGKDYLTHFFCSLTGDFKVKANWEIGFYNSSTGKITVFGLLPSSEVEIKPEDDVFQEKKVAVEELQMEKVKITADDALHTFKEKWPEFFPSETLGDGFLILQTYQGKTTWNFTFVTRTLRFITVKIDACSGEVDTHLAIDLVQKQK